MNTLLWTTQLFVALVFLYSGINKSVLSEEQLVAKGQTGVASLPVPLIRFIGIAEIAGAAGITVPWWSSICPILTPVTAVCFTILMLLACRIHYKRGELKNCTVNLFIFIACVFIAWQRFSQVK
jgi:hypothetical protein